MTGEDEIDTLLLRAGLDQEWRVVEDVARRYDRPQDAAAVAAEFGNAMLVRSRLLTCTLDQRSELMHAACRGGHLHVMQLCLEEGVDVKAADEQLFLLSAAAWAMVLRSGCC
jgi:hypothetical protein